MSDDYLAQCLERAVADPARKLDFVNALRAATIFVMGEIEGEHPTTHAQPVMKSGANVSLRSQVTPDGRTKVPFFSSLEKLRGFIKGPEQVSYLSIPAMKLFEIAEGTTLVLNPGSAFSSELSPEDVARLLSQGGPKA